MVGPLVWEDLDTSGRRCFQSHVILLYFFDVSAMGAGTINLVVNKLETVRECTLELFGDATYK